jgi:hypothetical protein
MGKVKKRHELYTDDFILILGIIEVQHVHQHRVYGVYNQPRHRLLRQGYSAGSTNPTFLIQATPLPTQLLIFSN